uniref:(northern house mosquito) hypothetical protein n=1 Tax=Culex pipiens TaxID=7175 RepID=A0A8D8JXM8_CULPI
MAHLVRASLLGERKKLHDGLEQPGSVHRVHRGFDQPQLLQLDHGLHQLGLHLGRLRHRDAVVVEDQRQAGEVNRLVVQDDLHGQVDGGPQVFEGHLGSVPLFCTGSHKW